MKWLERLKRTFTSKKTLQSRSWDENGLHALEGDLSIHIAWGDVRRVYAYKKDCFSVDQLRLIFMSDQDVVEFTEDDSGFPHLCALLNERLSVSAEWQIRLLASPAFETTFTAVYPTSDSDCLGFP